MKTKKQLEEEIESLEILIDKTDEYMGTYQEQQQSLNETLKQTNEIIKIIEELETPYPIDVFKGETEEGRLAKFGNDVRDSIKEQMITKLRGNEK